MGDTDRSHREEQPEDGEAPSGLPSQAPEPPPMGVAADEPPEQAPADPGEPPPEPGPDVMPGIPTDGEPPTSG